jgi:hypothetical protein
VNDVGGAGRELIASGDKLGLKSFQQRHHAWLGAHHSQWVNCIFVVCCVNVHKNAIGLECDGAGRIGRKNNAMRPQ